MIKRAVNDDANRSFSYPLCDDEARRRVRPRRQEERDALKNFFFAFSVCVGKKHPNCLHILQCSDTTSRKTCRFLFAFFFQKGTTFETKKTREFSRRRINRESTPRRA